MGGVAVLDAHEERECSGELPEPCRDQWLRVLLAIHGGLADDLLPGVEPLPGKDLFELPVPAGWVSPG